MWDYWKAKKGEEGEQGSWLAVFSEAAFASTDFLSLSSARGAVGPAGAMHAHMHARKQATVRRTPTSES